MKTSNGGGDSSIGRFSRSSSTRSARKVVTLPKSSYSTPAAANMAPAPRSPSLNCPPSPKGSPKVGPIGSPKACGGLRSPKVSLSSPSQTERAVFDFGREEAPLKSPKKFDYTDDDTGCRDNTIAGSSDCETYNFPLASPPKSSKVYNRRMYQSIKSDSVSSTKSSLEYSSTTKHPTGYQDIEYKICHSLDSDSQTTSSYRYSTTTSTSSRHSSFKEKKKPKCNIRTNPGYDEKYSSSKSINESGRSERGETSLQKCRCRKSTSDLTEMTSDDCDAGQTATTSLSRPSSPRRKGSVKGGLAYLASRRGSRDSLASNVSNEDIGPLNNFQNTARGRQRRTSNFLELPGKWRCLAFIPSRSSCDENTKYNLLFNLWQIYNRCDWTIAFCGDSSPAAKFD
ncbi:unnamed protein product [Acanthoscelides obtectus]|uniref:Uncharacterized protein n=1 Tax=Acanthoscelides obtectus TaxID=200917 RepID=A0A9P0PSC0_ACAOB|nr:unnamed protein product [Acanthoscelides obtectus]CAK1658801.1 hypothetical protein AOBTE_LOCUS21134 [Acanthoscelides obtectus]